MAAIWVGTIEYLRELSASRDFIDLLTSRFYATYGEPSPAEIDSWRDSIPAFLRVLSEPVFDPLKIVLEMSMPVGAERADIVLLGGSIQSPRAFIVELKGWSEAQLDAKTLEVELPGTELRQHPSSQVLNYQGKLKLFHSMAAEYDFRSSVFLYNMKASVRSQLEAASPSDLIRSAPLLSEEGGQSLAAQIADHLLPTSLAEDEPDRFAEAPYQQTRHLFDVISTYAEEIANRATLVLAEAGIGLTEEQEVLVESALASARAKDNKSFIVQGGPGSGKTLVAVTLLLRALQQHSTCVLAIRNNRLQAILRRCFDLSYPGASGTMMYFEPRTGTGIGHDHFQGSFDLVICDEAQRMESKIMRTVLARAPTSVVLLDETQRLNPPEQGTRESFAWAAREVGVEPTLAQLSDAVRCRGGVPYQDWVSGLLLEPLAGIPARLADEPWRNRYLFDWCDSIEELVGQLAELRDVHQDRVALVASFTESPGSMKARDHSDNIRVGYPLNSGWGIYRESDVQLYWLMRQPDYVQFWMNGKSNSLDRVASIYGAQGFESDFVGVIWGRDLVVRNRRWTLGSPRTCYDTIDGLLSRGRNRNWAAEARTLVENRYRIFLTRGIKGTLAFCEDAETREFFRGS